MTVRFRIRTQAGQELSFASREMFEDFVRAGDLNPEDLVYDGETGSWAPARTHPIVLEIEYEDEEEEAAPGKSKTADEAPSGGNALGLSLAAPAEGSADGEGGESTGPSGAPGESTGDAPGGSFGLELSLQEEVSPEDASRAFVERMKAEREAERELGRSVGVGGFTMETSGALADLVSEPVAPEPPKRAPPEPPRRTERRRDPEPDEPAGRRGGDTPPEGRPAPRTSAGTRGAGRNKVGILLVVAVIAGGGVVGVRLAQGGSSEDPSEAAPEVPVEAIPVEPRPTPPPEREPVIASTEAAVRERAEERFLTATQAELRDLQPVPEAWPTAEYLTLPSTYPEVVDVFQTYRSAIRAVRAGDQSRYRIAYEAALEDAGVADEEATDRLDVAMQRFAETAEARAAHYDRVEALATAAIRSHEALLEAEGLLVPGAPSDGVDPSAIGMGVAGRDADSQLLLEEVSDLLTDVLEADGAGPRTPENVRAWVWDGFLDAMTR
jgi:hypothetical protein